MTVTLGQMDWRLGVDSADFQRGLANAESQARGFGSKITGALATGAKVAFGAAVVGVGAFGAVLAQSVKEASAAEEITAQLNAVIKSTGGIAGVTAQAIQDHALALSQVTRFEDDAIVSADALLLTFTKIGKDVFPRATEAVLDLATTLKMDLPSAAKMVGKALNDPIAGLTAMGRAGVQFSKDQKDTIKALVEMGDVAGAQAIILKELEIQTGGSARAAGDTLAGQMDILKNALGNVKEEIGGALIPIIKDFITWIGPKLTAGLQRFSDWFRTSLRDVKEFAGKLGDAKDIIKDVISDVNKGEKIKWQDLMNLSSLFTNKLDIQRKFATIVTDVQTGIGEIKKAFDRGGLGAAAGKAWTMFTDGIKKAVESVDWEQVKADLLAAANTALEKVDIAIDSIVLAVKSVDWARVKAQLWLMGQTIKTELGWILADVGAWLQTQAPVLGASLNTMLKKAVTINGQMIDEDATLAYSIGAALTKLFIEGTKISIKVLAIGPLILDEILGSLFNASQEGGGLGGAVSTAFSAVGDFLSGAFDAMMTQIAPEWLMKFSTWWDGLWASFKAEMSLGTDTGPDIIASIEAAVDTWIAGVNAKVASFVTAGGNLIKGLAKGITDWLWKADAAIEAAGASIIAAIKKFFGIESPSTVMAGIGADIVAGLKQGIANAASDFKNWIVGWARGIIPEPLWKFFGIDSPSKLMIDMGRNIGGGLAQGILQSSGDVAAAMGVIMAQIGGTRAPALAFAPAMVSGASGGSNGAGNRGSSGSGGHDLPPITINVYAAGGNADAVRGAAIDGVNEALRARGYR